jgi:hypothetical protein
MLRFQNNYHKKNEYIFNVIFFIPPKFSLHMYLNCIQWSTFTISTRYTPDIYMLWKNSAYIKNITNYNRTPPFICYINKYYHLGCFQKLIGKLIKVTSNSSSYFFYFGFFFFFFGRHGRDHMVVGFTATCAISAYHRCCFEVESRSGRGLQHYVIKSVSDLPQVGRFPRFPPPIKLTATK